MARTDYKLLVEAIVRKMATVPDIGNVHPSRMFTEKPEDFRSIHFCEAQKRIHSWTVTREGFTDEQVETDHGHEVVTRFRIRGYLSNWLPEDSDTKFKQLIDGVSAALDDDSDLDGLCEIQFPVQCEVDTIRLFWEVYCHYCELTLLVQEYHKSTT